MKNKIKILWFGLVPLAWYIDLKFVEWISNYPINWSYPTGLGIFLMLSGIGGSLLLLVGSFVLAFGLQD